MSSKSNILQILEKNRGTYVSGEELAQQLQISRSAIWKAISELKKEGYQIISVTNKGYCLSDNRCNFSRRYWSIFNKRQPRYDSCF